jgi:integrase/recombinase XerD
MSALTPGSLSRDIKAFLAFKRSLGYRYREAERQLSSFQRFVRTQVDGNASVVWRAAIDAWVMRDAPRTARTRASDLTVVRELCLYRRRRDPRAFVPERIPALRRRFLPYLLSHAEVQASLRAARRYCRRDWSGETMYMLILILYCTGLRIGEALRLQLVDLDLKAATFLIRESKGRTRLVAFGDDLAQKIKQYLRNRAAWAQSGHSSQVLLLDLHGQSLSVKRASRLIRVLWRHMGLKPARGRAGPRPYDLRHAFARGRLTAWYRKGVDLHAQLPWLSAYLGHDDLLGTETYLHATPQLLRTASRRFEKRFRQ